MAGFIRKWGPSQKQHDRLIGSLLGPTRRTEEALAAIFSNVTQIAGESEKLGRRAAQDAGSDFPTPQPGQSLAIVALNTIVQTLKGPRHEMGREEVAFYRSGLRSILRLVERNLRESAKLTKAIEDGRENLRKIQQFYSTGGKPPAPGKRPSKRPGSPKRRR